MQQELRDVLLAATSALAFADGVLTAPEVTTGAVAHDACSRIWEALQDLGVCVDRDYRIKERTVSELREAHEKLSMALWVAERVVNLAGKR